MSIEEARLRDVHSLVIAKFGKKNWRFKTEVTKETIETYFGVLVPFTLVEELEDKEISRHVFVKLPTVNKTIREASAYMWDTEVYVYNTFVPIWRQLPNVNVDELIPNCYYANATPNKQILILKDMRYEGFQHCKERFLDFEHVVVAIKSLAQFHALSFIIKNKQEEATESLLKPYTHVYPVELNKAIYNSFQAHSPMFRGSKYEHFWEDTLANYETVANSTAKTKCLLFGHGDYWLENIMFKYEGNKPVKACLLDFQACRIMTPAFDFLYFIFNCTNSRLRRQHYCNFITEYYETFKSTLLDNDILRELLYTREDFISDLKTVAPLCVMRICLGFSLWLGFESDSLIKSKNLWEDNEQRNKEEQYFKGILVDTMEDLHNYGYITL